MIATPRIWRFLVTEWVAIAPRLAWSWWYAMTRSRWSLVTEWRQALLVFDRRPERTS
jgi:hypothetical protein